MNPIPTPAQSGQETPRTDAASDWTHANLDGLARRLERELNAANAKLAKRDREISQGETLVLELGNRLSNTEAAEQERTAQLHALQSAARKVVEQRFWDFTTLDNAITDLSKLLPPATQPNDTAGEKFP